uniref:Uncharacterized protein n=1 Tax=Rhizophora mucronata TaxID=61149 RepID=A0A2P2NUE8_RHIMU
MVCSFEFILH